MSADGGSLFERGARVVSVRGPFGSRVLVEMPAGVASELFEGLPLGACAPSVVVEATQRDLDGMPDRVSRSGLAAVALALARELEDPFNSATSKSMCAKALMDALAALRALAPPNREADGVDDIAERRARRRAAVGGAAAADLPRS